MGSEINVNWGAIDRLHQIAANENVEAFEELCGEVIAMSSIINVRAKEEDRTAMDVAVERFERAYKETDHPERLEMAKRMITIIRDHGGTPSSLDPQTVIATTTTDSKEGRIQALALAVDWTVKTYAEALESAIRVGKRPTVDFLMSVPETVQHFLETEGKTPFMYAVEKEKNDLASALLERTDKSAKDRDGCTTLDYAARRNHWGLCHTLVDAGVPLTDTKTLGDIVEKAPRLALKLMEQKDLDWSSAAGSDRFLARCLHSAGVAYWRRLVDEAETFYMLAAALRDRGLPVKDVSTDTAWHHIEQCPVKDLASRLTFLECSDETLTELLIYTIRDSSLRARWERFAAILCVIEENVDGKVAAIPKHISFSFNRYDLDNRNRTALSLVLERGREEEARMLIWKGANLAQTTQRGQTLFDDALKGGLWGLARELYAKGVRLGGESSEERVKDLWWTLPDEGLALLIELGELTPKIALECVIASEQTDRIQFLAERLVWRPEASASSSSL